MSTLLTLAAFYLGYCVAFSAATLAVGWRIHRAGHRVAELHRGTVRLRREFGANCYLQHLTEPAR